MSMQHPRSGGGKSSKTSSVTSASAPTNTLRFDFHRSYRTVSHARGRRARPCRGGNARWPLPAGPSSLQAAQPHAAALPGVCAWVRDRSVLDAGLPKVWCHARSAASIWPGCDSRGGAVVSRRARRHRTGQAPGGGAALSVDAAALDALGLSALARRFGDASGRRTRSHLTASRRPAGSETQRCLSSNSGVCSSPASTLAQPHKAVATGPA
jgi:hypothetical protein